MLTRRDVLAAGTAVALLPRVALAAAPGDRRLVVVVLRGALDGLAAVPPYADPHFAGLRGKLLVPASRTPDLDGRFGLHPALAPLGDMYRAGEMSVLHAAATPYRNRSHFDAQDVLENGSPAADGAVDGWLNRALTLYGKTDRRLGIVIGQVVPLILRGKAPVASWLPPSLPLADSAFLQQLASLYADDPVLAPALKDGLASRRLTEAVLGDRPQSGQRSPFPERVRIVGSLMADPRGPRVAVFQLGGWDTHSAQGAATGRLAGHLSILSSALKGLRRGLGAAWAQTAVLVVTEFGRTARINGTGGTDHGTASAAFVLGGAVDGGRVLGDWPGLGPGRLYQGRDLGPTTDLRALFAAALIDHMGLPAADVRARVFPTLGQPPLRDLFRA